MITVTLERCPDGYIRRFSAVGHSGYADPGSDIICAAISAITQTAIGSLQDLAGLKPETRLEDGLIECLTSDPLKMSADQYQTAKILLDSMALGCRQIEASYGKKFVRIKESIFT